MWNKSNHVIITLENIVGLLGYYPVLVQASALLVCFFLNPSTSLFFILITGSLLHLLVWSFDEYGLRVHLNRLSGNIYELIHDYEETPDQEEAL